MGRPSLGAIIDSLIDRLILASLFWARAGLDKEFQLGFGRQVALCRNSAIRVVSSAINSVPFPVRVRLCVRAFMCAFLRPCARALEDGTQLLGHIPSTA